MRTHFARVVIVLGLIASVQGRSSSTGWMTVAPMNLDRYGAVGAAIEGKLYVVSGISVQWSSPWYPSTTFEVYDPDRNAWTLYPSGPLATAHGAAAVIDRRLYIVGGCVNGDCGGHPTDRLQIFDADTGLWTDGAPLPAHRHLMSVGSIGGKRYVAGGNAIGFQAVPTLESYDPASDTWATLAPMHEARAGAFSGVIDGLLYVAGGSNNTTLLDSVEVYDPTTNNWTARAPMPVPHYHGASGVVDGVLYAISGATSLGDIGSAVAAYDATTDTWSDAPPISMARFGLVAGVIDGSLYAIGGNDAAGVPQSITEVLRLPAPSCRDIDRLASRISDEHLVGGRAQSLTATLSAAANACDRRQPAVAADQLRAFVREVRAQSGKMIPSYTADAFVAEAERVIQRLLS